MDSEDRTQLSAEDATTLSVDGQRELELAPMLDVTGREFRSFMRILSRRMINWTEMVVDQTLCHTENLDEHLGY